MQHKGPTLFEWKIFDSTHNNNNFVFKMLRRKCKVKEKQNFVAIWLFMFILYVMVLYLQGYNDRNFIKSPELYSLFVNIPKYSKI